MRAAEQLDAFPEVGVATEECPNERYTPHWLFDPLHEEFRFTVDVCATAESAKCERFFTLEQNGLAQPWTGERVFCNPPYDDIGAWVRKAEFEHFRGCPLVVMLVPSWTDRTWWHEHIEPHRDRRSPPDLIGRAVRLETRFLRGRVRFGLPGNPEGHGSGSPPFWCCLLVWRRG
jgi:hypothetical protein